jgi:hypothetical protein
VPLVIVGTLYQKWLLVQWFFTEYPEWITEPYEHDLTKDYQKPSVHPGFSEIKQC